MTAGAIYKRLLHIARPYWLHLSGLFALSLVTMPLTLLTPLPVKIVVDSVVGHRPLPAPLARLVPFFTTFSSQPALVIAIGLLLILTLIYQLQASVSGILTTYLSEKLVFRFRSELFRHMQRLSLAYHDMTGSSDSLYRIQYDAMSIQFIAIDGTIPFIVSLATLLAMLVVIYRLDPALALVSLIIMPLFVLVLRHFRPRLHEEWGRVKTFESAAMSVVQEVLGAVRVVKAFGQEDREQTRFTHHSGKELSARVRVGFVEGAMSVSIGLITAVGSALVLYVGTTHVLNGTLTLGNLLLVMGYLAALYVPLETLSARIGLLQSHLASAERAFVLLDQAPDVAEKPDACNLERAKGNIEFQNVAFGYDSDTRVLQGVNLTVKEGECVGIVGRTGAGKTTLTNLLLRFYDPSEGRILLDGIDIREYKVAALRNQFSIVLQDTVLFSTTIAENISYAKPGASEEEIVAASVAANAHDFIMSLPEKYDTLVGERGYRLSGGERQRISLARAFLKRAPLLILDEPTSSVDKATEAGIMDAMNRLMTGRTTFLVTHRDSTLAHADVVVAVESGGVRIREGAGAVPA
jgi:ATP-binding cassette subfamily B protein